MVEIREESSNVPNQSENAETNASNTQRPVETRSLIVSLKGNFFICYRTVFRSSLNKIRWI